MIPKWQMGAIFAAVAVLLAAAIYTSPYGHALLTGACNDNPRPLVCNRAGTRGGGMAGRF